MKRNHEAVVMDERQMLIGLKTARVTLVFVLVCLLAAMIVRLVRSDELGWEFWVLIGSCVVGAVTNRLLGNVEAPKGLLGKPLPTGSSRKDRATRRKNYLLSSLLFAGFCTVVDAVAIFAMAPDGEAVLPFEWAAGLSNVAGKLLAIGLSFAVMLAVFYAGEYLIVEKIRLKQYKRMLAELDDEEDE